MSFRVQVQGVDEALQDLQKLARKKPEEFKRGVVKFALLVQREAQRRTPVDTGALRNSATTRIQPDTAHGFEVWVSFMVLYSIYVHEDLYAHHNVGEAKFLENAVRTMLPRLEFTVLSEVV